MTGILDRMKRLFSQNHPFRFFLAIFLQTLGVYWSFPERGIVATFPLMFLFAVLAAWVKPVLSFCLLSAGGIALCYGVAGALPNPFLFAVVSAATACFGFLCFKGLKWIVTGHRIKGSALFFFAVAVGILLPALYLGSSFSYTKAKDRAQAYLEEKYPDQRFEDLILFYDAGEQAYRATVIYEYEENFLDSTLLFYEKTVEDGFLQDYSVWMLDIRKTALIKQFRDVAPDPVVFDSLGFTEEGKKLEVYRGSFGHLREEMIPLMKYSVTFRQEQANMKGFLENTKELLRFLKEKETVFGELVVYGHWQDENIYTCTLTPETKEEDLLYLCVSLKDQPQS